MTDFYNKLRTHIEPGARIVIALSGGPDSVYLFHHLLACRQDHDLRLEACHLHHGLRENADGDLAFVRDLCQKSQVPLHERKEDVIGYAKKKKISIEEAGRILRYKFFYELAGGDYISLGHHQGDQAETVLIRLVRGTGIKGLGGMRTLEGQIFRPLLDISKEEILAWLDSQGLAYRIDETNLEPMYLRNKMRLEVIPSLEEINPQVSQALTSLASQAREAEDFLERLSQEAYGNLASWEGEDLVLDLGGLKGLDRAIRTRVLHQALTSYLGSQRNITAKHIQALEDLLFNESGKEVHIRRGALARRSFDRIILGPPSQDKTPGTRPLSEGTNEVGSYRLEVTRTQEGAREAGPHEAYFDGQDLGQLFVRTRRPGDRVLLFDGSGHKKLKDIFIEKKVDRDLRDRIPLVLEGDDIIWVAGVYRSGHRKVTARTRETVKIRMVKNYDK